MIVYSRKHEKLNGKHIKYIILFQVVNCFWTKYKYEVPIVRP